MDEASLPLTNPVIMIYHDHSAMLCLWIGVQYTSVLHQIHQVCWKYRYPCHRTFDSMLWAMLQTKPCFAQILQWPAIPSLAPTALHEDAPQEEGLDEGEGKKLSNPLSLGWLCDCLTWCSDDYDYDKLWLKMIHPQNGWEIWKANSRRPNFWYSNPKQIHVLYCFILLYPNLVSKFWDRQMVPICQIYSDFISVFPVTPCEAWARFEKIGSWRSFHGECEPTNWNNHKKNDLWFDDLFVSWKFWWNYWPGNL